MEELKFKLQHPTLSILTFIPVELGFVDVIKLSLIFAITVHRLHRSNANQNNFFIFFLSFYFGETYTTC
jgi:hypothetical protein